MKTKQTSIALLELEQYAKNQARANSESLAAYIRRLIINDRSKLTIATIVS